MSDEIPAISSNLELGTATTRACIPRFPVLKDNLAFHPLFFHVGLFSLVATFQNITEELCF